MATPVTGFVGLRLHELPVAGEHGDDPGQLLAVDLRLHGLVEPLQAVDREADGIGRGLGQGRALAEGTAARSQQGAEQDGGEPVNSHDARSRSAARGRPRG